MTFADTAYFLALLNPQDQWHEPAVRWSQTVRGPLMTTTWILVEIGDALATTRHRQWFPDFAADLVSAAQIRIIAASDEWFRSGVAFYRARPDKEWSLTDCLSFEVMRELGVREALTSDQHFVQAGFRALLRE